MSLSLVNVFFVTAIFILFYLGTSATYKVRVLLLGSLAFYVYNEPLLTPVLACISGLAFVVGNLLHKYGRYKKKILLFFFLILLCFYYPLKYNDTFESILQNAFHFEGLRWLYLPLGLSFYSYKTMSYVLDIYYERAKPQKSFQSYLLFVSFFPQIFCGPIMGPDDFFSQLNFSIDFNFDNILSGLRLIVIGMFKKLVLANNLFLLIQYAYLNPQTASGFVWVLISIITRFYIYYDFSGYSDISNGISLLFGIRVPKNFDLPFKSKNITEFWRRWHISLSSWIRDYVYYPLVSKFSNYAGIYISLIISFICLGLWHGDHINYLLYGLINGVAVAVSTYLVKKRRNTIPTSNKLKLVVSRLFFYFFLIFLPSILLMVPNATILSLVVKSFVHSQSWFSFNYFVFPQIGYVVYMMIPLAIGFELVSTIHGENLKTRFSTLKITYRLICLALGIFIIFALISPALNYRFLYQGF